MCVLYEKSDSPAPGVIWFHAINGPGDARIIVYADKDGAFLKTHALKAFLGYQTVRHMTMYTKPSIFTRTINGMVYRCISADDAKRIVQHGSTKVRQRNGAWLEHVVLPAVENRIKAVPEKFVVSTETAKVVLNESQVPKEEHYEVSLSGIQEDILKARSIAIALGYGDSKDLPDRIVAIIKAVNGYDCANLLNPMAGKLTGNASHRHIHEECELF